MVLSIVEACEKGLVQGWRQSFEPIYVQQGAVDVQAVAALQAHFGMAQRFVLVGDESTLKAAGRRMAQTLGDVCDVVALAEPVYASEMLVEQLCAQAPENALIIAVGGGSINDVVKRASFLRQQPYICVPTAPSMNGYLSPTASLLVGRKKTSLPAHMPAMLLLDWDVLAHAPKRLAQAGVGDALCRVTAETDMWLAHRLLGEHYPDYLFETLRAAEKPLLDVLDKPHDAWVKPLMELLLLGGLAMVEMGSSAPASQGEHMLAHAVHMAHGSALSPALHGEEIAVTSMYMLRLQHHIMQAQPHVHYCHPNVNAMMVHFDQPTLHACLSDYDTKNITPERVEAMNVILNVDWDDMLAQWKAITVAPETMEHWWHLAGLKMEALDVGWPVDALAVLSPIAALTRERFTALDLVYLAR